MGVITDRRTASTARIIEIQKQLVDAAKVADGKACVYVTGSFGRREAGPHSDLDLFIVGKNSGQKTADGNESSKLARLDDILIKADLIEVTRKLKFPEFSGDGKYLIHYSVDQLIRTLGTPSDDVTNTFTARLLLLLESSPLIGEAVYHEIIGEVIGAYWRDYEGHKSTFSPAFFANDILRLWRTFCVNYEARTEREPEDLKAKGRLTNYKLKHSRLLTCYSALLYLLATYKANGTVSPEQALEMISRSPTERIEWLKTAEPSAAAAIDKLLEQYSTFLSITAKSERELVDRLKVDGAFAKQLTDEAFAFGDSVFEALKAVGDGNRFYRLLVV